MRAQWQIHFCVLLWGFTAILGKLISLPALGLVVWRMLLVSAVLIVLPRVWRGLLRLPRRTLGIYAGIGVIVALHWLTFYGAIKLANASVAATCIALAPVFLALVEPLITAKRFEPPRELALGIAGGAGRGAGGRRRAIGRCAFGRCGWRLSALLVAMFGSLNKRYIEAQPIPLTVTGTGTGRRDAVPDRRRPGDAGAGRPAAAAGCA